MRIVRTTTALVVLLLLQPSVALAELPELLGIIMSDTVQTLFGTRILPLGDQNGDGYDDIMTWDYRFASYLYYGGDPFDSAAALRFNNTMRFTSVIGDINGDDFSDFTLPTREEQYKRKLNLYYGGPDVDTVRDCWFGYDTLYAWGYSVLGDDINANGTDEIISWATGGKAVVMFELGLLPDSVPDMIIPPANQGAVVSGFGERVISGDFNGDGKIDLACSYRPARLRTLEGAVYLYWGGAGFDSIPDMIVPRPGHHVEGAEQFSQVLERLGDFNGDGWDDFLAGVGVSFDDTVNTVFFGGPDIDTVPDLWIPDRMHVARLAGDVNNDGYNDLITSLPLPWSGSGNVYIYFGGPDADSLWDVRIRNDDLDGYQTEVGMDCSGIGDFNGDSIDDFAFSALNSSQRGMIYIFAGSGDLTDVEDNDRPLVPENFALFQNYPNPFNASTVIEFQLSCRERVSLDIFNVMGRKVASLVYSEELPPGRHSYEWDGTVHDGQVAASGMYLYRLRTDTGQQVRKMLLLK